MSGRSNCLSDTPNGNRTIHRRAAVARFHRRALILFGRNVASYKFALGQSLLELGA